MVLRNLIGFFFFVVLIIKTEAYQPPSKYETRQMGPLNLSIESGPEHCKWVGPNILATCHDKETPIISCRTNTCTKEVGLTSTMIHSILFLPHNSPKTQFVYATLYTHQQTATSPSVFCISLCFLIFILLSHFPFF